MSYVIFLHSLVTVITVNNEQSPLCKMLLKVQPNLIWGFSGLLTKSRGYVSKLCTTSLGPSVSVYIVSLLGPSTVCLLQEEPFYTHCASAERGRESYFICIIFIGVFWTQMSTSCKYSCTLTLCVCVCLIPQTQTEFKTCQKLQMLSYFSTGPVVSNF